MALIAKIYTISTTGPRTISHINLITIRNLIIRPYNHPILIIYKPNLTILQSLPKPPSINNPLTPTKESYLISQWQESCILKVNPKKTSLTTTKNHKLCMIQKRSRKLTLALIKKSLKK